MRGCWWWWLVAALWITGSAYGQTEVRVSGNYQNERLDVVLEDLMARYDLSINFAPDRVQQHRVTVRLRNAPLREALDKLLATVPFRFMITGQAQVLIVPDPKKNLAPPPPSTASLRGRISDAETGEPLPHATVGIVATNRGTAANAEGFFALPDLATDSIELEIRYLGYKPIRLMVSDSVDLATLNIALTPVATVLHDVVIEEATPQSAIWLTEQPGVAHLDPNKVAVLPNLGMPDVFQALQLIPGISATQGTSGNLQIRGGTPDQNLILFDDIPLYHLDHFSGIYSTINPLAVQTMTVYKGGYPANFDGRSAGVVDVRSRSGNRQQVAASANMNLLSGNLALDVPIGKKLTWTFSGRVAYDDVLRTTLYDSLAQHHLNNVKEPDPLFNLFSVSQAESLESDFDFYDLHSKISFYPTPKDNLSLSALLGGDRVSVEIEGGYENENNRGFWEYENEEDSQWDHAGASLSWGRQWNEHWHSKFLTSLSVYNSTAERRTLTAFGNPGFRQNDTARNLRTNTLADGQVLSEVSYQPNSHHKIDVGVTLNTLNTRFSSRVWRQDTLANGILLASQGGRFSWYVQDTWTTNSGTRIIAGLRRNRYLADSGTTTLRYWAPRFSVEQRLLPTLTVKGAMGVYQQFLHQVSANRFSTNNPFAWVLADQDDYKVQRSVQWTFGAQWQFAPGWMVDGEAYWRRTTGLTELYEFQLRSRRTETFLFNSISARVAGLDLTVHKDLGAYRGWVSYSYGIVNHVDATGTLNGGNPYPALQDQRHEINLVQLYSVGAWNFSSTLMYGSGRPYTPPTVNAMGQETVLNPRGVNSERLPAYFRLDLAAQWGFRWKSLEGTLGASVYNVTDHYNIQSRIYGLRAEELQSGDQGPQDLRWEVTPLDAVGLGITPNVFLNLQF